LREVLSPTRTPTFNVAPASAEFNPFSGSEFEVSYIPEGEYAVSKEEEEEEENEVRGKRKGWWRRFTDLFK
jgi:hypothetical protein